MERANANSSSRKRTRDQGDVEKEARKGKKPQLRLNHASSSSNDQNKGHHDVLNEGSGVFDFPWLKEGVTFKAEEYFDQESMFLGSFARNFDKSCEENNAELAIGGIGGMSCREEKFEDDGLWSSLGDQVEGFESVDRVLSLVIDQPGIDVGFNKA